MTRVSHGTPIAPCMCLTAVSSTGPWKPLRPTERFISRRIMIQLKQVERVYPLKGGPFYALRGINLEIKEGDFLSIMGPSGSGKSTLLHILGLHDGAWGGEYWFRDLPLHRLDQKKRA